MLKIAFIYIVIVFSIILGDVRLPSFDRTKPCISVYSTHRIGEGLLQDRVERAAKNMGWNVIRVRLEEHLPKFCLTAHFYYSALSLVNLIYKPIFNLAVTHYFFAVPYGYNVTYLNVPNSMIISRSGFVEKYKHLAKYDAYVDLYSVSNGKNPKLLNALERSGNKDALIIPMYISHDYVEYSPAKRDRMLLVGSLWGCNRASDRLKDALYNLGKNEMLIAYGIEDLEFLDDAFKGMVEDSGEKGKSMDQIFALQKKYGISLVVHSLEHMIAGMPTSRVAESAAAGAIIISDGNKFIKNTFGDSALYFNSLVLEDEIYSQLKNHIEWIRSHPKEAEQKARKAHKIFMDNFAIEKQLVRLLNIVESRNSSSPQ
ncbi:MAG: glycosyltransferase family 1 protein [Rickettsiaceae bacterium]|nr:glycosyltransferase family 1 protein [Rickettsiaceae bacterium]